MRILFLLTQDLESPAGVGRYFPWARALVSRGHQVSIVTLHADYTHVSQKKFIRDGVQIQYVAQMHVLKRGDQKYYYSTPRLLVLTAWATWKLAKAALTFPADIIQIGKPQPMNGLAGWFAHKLRGKPLCVDCDDLESANNRFGNSWQQRIVRSFERWLPLHADHITTHTQVLRQQLLDMGIPLHLITYLPHGFDRHRFSGFDQNHVDVLRQQYNLEGKMVIVYVGSMSLGSHAVDLLLDAFRFVKEKQPNSVLMLVGGGEDFENLKDQADQMKLGTSIVFVGRVQPESVPGYYRLGHVSVDPVPDNASGRASLSLKMFESWASQVPLVTVDVGDRHNILGNPPAGVVVPPGNSEALANGILQIISNPELAKILAQRGLERVSSFDWDRHAEKMETVYASLWARKAML